MVWLTFEAVSKFNSVNGPIDKTVPFCIQCITQFTCLWCCGGSKYHGILYSSVMMPVFFQFTQYWLTFIRITMT